ncbi:MAG: NF038122 family metalloprotease [Xanthobacteraceae bacterium]
MVPVSPSLFHQDARQPNNMIPDAFGQHRANNLQVLFGYSALYNALQADAGKSSYQATADSSLGATNPTSGTFDVNSANAKALGLLGASSTLDGYIGVSSALPFEYNQTASSGNYDAIAMVQHELTEDMGRVGSVGAVIGNGVYTPLDLFRYTSTDNADPADGTPERALTQQGPNTDYFSINGGVTNLGDYNASNSSADYADWNANTMGSDPFGDAFAGVTQPMSGNDAIEVAAIGWDLTAKGTTLAQSATDKTLV